MNLLSFLAVESSELLQPRIVVEINGVFLVSLLLSFFKLYTFQVNLDYLSLWLVFSEVPVQAIALCFEMDMTFIPKNLLNRRHQGLFVVTLA